MKKILLAGLAALTLGSYEPASYEKEEEKVKLAQCLVKDNNYMYGASWCPACRIQQKEFGSKAWKVFEPHYVECDDDLNKKFCENRGIEAYPTWIFKSGERHEGAYKLEELAEYSGCDKQ